jgi:hypothetical protein
LSVDHIHLQLADEAEWVGKPMRLHVWWFHVNNANPNPWCTSEIIWV